MDAGNLDAAVPGRPVVGYESRPVTKPPNWHGLVTLDMVLNNLSTGLFLVAAIGELLDPIAFGPLAPLAYPLALLFLIGDLVCLVLDLGDPKRFHHMLRVWKPSSPMSLGTWGLTAYSMLITLLAVASLAPFAIGGAGLDLIRRVLLAGGVVLAVAGAAYKGVLFSTTAQRGWAEARWMGGYLVNSALCLGVVEVLLLATLTGHAAAPMVDALRLAARLLLALNLIAIVLLAKDVRGPLGAARGPDGIAGLALLAIGAGVLVPFLLVGAPGPAGVAAALGLMLVGAVAVRAAIVQLPHQLADGRAQEIQQLGSSPRLAEPTRRESTEAHSPITPH